MVNLTNLNEHQLSAVLAKGNCCIIACPGSGKTRTLTARACHLHNSNKNTNIVVVSFTNQSAKEIDARITKEIGRPSKRITIGTFHSLALGQLKQALGSVRILNTNERLGIISRAISYARCDMDVKKGESIIERYQYGYQTANDENENGDAIFKKYRQLLHSYKAMDFQDLILNSIHMLMSHDLEPLPCTHLLIDEFQDIDPVQYEWMRLQSAGGCEITVCGDDDQSIYGFRRALGYGGMIRFIKEFNAQMIVLDINYRSCSEIMISAGHLISANTNRMPKALRSAKGPGGKVGLITFDSRLDECMGIAKSLSAIDSSKWAVISRTNQILDVLEMAVAAAGIIYRRLGSKSIWDKKHTAAFLTFLDSLYTGSNLGVEHLFNWLGVPETTVCEITDWAYGSIINALVNTGDSLTINARNERWSGYLAEFREFIIHWMVLVKRDDASGLLHAIASWMARVVRTESAKKELELAADILSNGSGTIHERLRRVHFSRVRTNKDCLTLVTAHGSKGLEWPNVWLMCVELGILPHKDSTDFEEERRLCYVAMTRAMQILTVSCVDSVRSDFLLDARLM